MQGDPPSVRLPGHPSGAGFLLEWRKNADGSKEYLVEIVEITSGYRGGLQDPRPVWFQAHEVEQIPGEDYSRVPRSRAQPERP